MAAPVGAFRSRFATEQIRQQLEQNTQVHWGAFVLAAWAKQAEIARQNPIYAKAPSVPDPMDEPAPPLPPPPAQ